MKVTVGDIVVPGDIALQITEDAKKMKVVLGPGIRKEGDEVYICKAGILRKKHPNIYWIDNHQKRYVPARGDNVIGVVTLKAGDIYRVDIGGSFTAALSYLAFEGATKKNRPDVLIGDLVFAKLLVAGKDMEPELVCVDSHGKKGRLGILSDGFVFSCSLNLIRKLLNPKCPLLDTLQKEMPFEIVIGMNGKIWIKTNSTKEAIALGNAILGSEFLNDQEISKMCINIATTLTRY